MQSVYSFKAYALYTHRSWKTCRRFVSREHPKKKKKSMSFLVFPSFRISGIPKLGMLREGLKLFISHFLLKNVQSQRPAEQAALLSERAQVATKAMEAKEAKLKL